MIMKKWHVGVAFICAATLLSFGATKVQASENVSLDGRMHVQNIGWRNAETQNGVLRIGTTGRALHLEAFQIASPALQAELTKRGIHLEYVAHVANVGWQKVSYKNENAGTTGRNLPIEAVCIAVKDNKTGKDSDIYEVRYRAHLRNIGWQNWTSRGNIAGTTGRAIPVEAIEIQLIKKSEVKGILDVKQDGSKVTMTVRPTESASDIQSVSIPTWGEANGQNDIKWYPTKRQADGSYQTTVDLANHKEQGKFFMHAYAATKDGRNVFLAAKTVEYKQETPAEPSNPSNPGKTEEPTQPTLKQATFELDNIQVPWSRTDRVIDESYLKQAYKGGTDEYGQPLSIDKLKITNSTESRTIKGGTDYPVQIEVSYQAKNGIVKCYASVSVIAPSYSLEGVRKEMLKLVNDLRANVGVQPVQYDESLNKASDVRVNELTTKYSHVRPNGEGSSTALKQFVSETEYYENYIGGGENIQVNYILGDDYTISKRLFESWKNSPGHYQNMINPDWNVFGFSYINEQVPNYNVFGEKIGTSYKFYAQQFFSEKVSY
ncbi:GBS Bsp-like repeat-containing protein [Enterococcus cecorum]|nr:GBS Bsp-like repeat-containing protein [Enterococcus cecorum]